jgi:hypothetical protein
VRSRRTHHDATLFSHWIFSSSSSPLLLSSSPLPLAAAFSRPPPLHSLTFSPSQIPGTYCHIWCLLATIRRPDSCSPTRQGTTLSPPCVCFSNPFFSLRSGGAISYNPNFVYGPNGSPVIQPDPVRDMPWRYSDAGDPRDYKVVTAATNGGDTPDYELINTGPYESDGSEWGVRPQGNTPVNAGYFPKQLYPGSYGYNYPGSVPSPAVGKAAWMAANAGQMVEPSHVGIDMPSQAFYS